MKKLSVVLGLILAIVAVPAFAESDDSVNRGVRDDFEAKKAEIQERIKENKDKMKETREDLRKDLKSVDKEVRKETKEDVKGLKREGKDDRRDLGKEVSGAKVRAGVAIRVFEATIVRLETLSGRIESRLTKLGGAGASTTDATALVNAAKLNIADAKGHITVLKSLESTISTSTATSTATTTEPIKLNFDKIKSEVKAAREDLTNAKQNLMRAVTAIKKIENALRKSGVVPPTATSTATTTTATTTATSTNP